MLLEKDNSTLLYECVNGQNNKRAVVPSRKQVTVDSTEKSATFGADSWTKQHIGKRSEIEIYHGELRFMPASKIRKEGQKKPRSKFPQKSPPKRAAKDITRFSKKSRFRMYRKMNRIKTRSLSKALFAHLTARANTYSAENLQHIFKKSFLPRLKKAIPAACWMWKLEPHESGKPHYHMIIWSKAGNLNINTRYYKKAIRLAWRKSINQHDRAAQLYSVDIEGVNSEKQARIYISKYMTKLSTGYEPDFTGRRWGVSKNLPLDPITAGGISKEKEILLLRFIKGLMKGKGKYNDFMETACTGQIEFFLWLSPDEIKEILSILSLTPQKNNYIRYLESGSTLPSQEDIDYLFDTYG